MSLLGNASYIWNRNSKDFGIHGNSSLLQLPRMDVRIANPTGACAYSYSTLHWAKILSNVGNWINNIYFIDTTAHMVVRCSKNPTQHSCTNMGRNKIAPIWMCMCNACSHGNLQYPKLQQAKRTCMSWALLRPPNTDLLHQWVLQTWMNDSAHSLPVPVDIGSRNWNFHWNALFSLSKHS